jgi:two-component system sensor histidine kinase KdpD
VLALPNISLVFLAAVLLVAVRSSLGPALACAALSFLTYDFLFIPPNFSFAIQREEDVLTLVFFLLMAALTGNLAARQRRQLQALRETQEETSQLLDLSRKLTAATDRQAVISAAGQHLNGWSDLQVCLLNRDARAAGKSRPAARCLHRSRTRRRRLGLAARSTGGHGHRHLPGRWWWWPLSVERAAGAARRLRQRASPERPASAPADRVESAAGPGAGPRALARIWKPRACTAKPSNCAAPCWPRCPTICARR